MSEQKTLFGTVEKKEVAPSGWTKKLQEGFNEAYSKYLSVWEKKRTTSDAVLKRLKLAYQKAAREADHESILQSIVGHRHSEPHVRGGYTDFAYAMRVTNIQPFKKLAEQKLNPHGDYPPPREFFLMSESWQRAFAQIKKDTGKSWEEVMKGCFSRKPEEYTEELWWRIKSCK